ncbi:NAD-dependent protein deacetylase, SIR2 family [Arthrobacter alpinus]|uniref:protein acetyllysine N-acetyltransferase n=1 Tax=Arthrobacter alpinus TaxID=656366 RepID=A0A1H5FNQ5_9MICC|nr:NAD-dependent protein deacetylase [Arthrobacter alpinus]SEE05047.1 NAD-dependent protein deacetylase, SIR2 family [Arthrobacter alpinus]
MDKVRPGIGQTAFAKGSPLPPDGLAADAQRFGDLPAGALSAGDIEALDRLAEMMRHRRVALLTGAGLSTDSGIPDYRGPDSAPRQPLTYQEFVGDPLLRQRYWARNHIGWAHMHRAEPNVGHFAAAALERAGHLTGIVTQNVDRLHEDAGASNVVDLHGRFDQVVCMNCQTTYSRSFLATILAELNPGFLEAVNGAPIGPDADADIADELLIASFKIAKCPLCGGMLKPDFVFFGENVPKERVERSFAMVEAAELLLVAGSSLTVMSGLRFVKRAAKDLKHVVIINRGETRGDPLANAKLETGVGESLSYLAGALGLDWHNR